MKDILILQSQNGMYYGDFNDFVLNDKHDLATVEYVNKITQDVVKILLTLKNSSPLFKNYGTSIASLINSRDSANIQDSLREEIIYSLSYVKKSNERETINIQELVSADIQNKVNGYSIILTIKLTNGELLKVNV